MKPVLALVSLIVFLLTVVGCSKQSPTEQEYTCRSYLLAYVTAITGPDTVSAGVYTKYGIHYYIPNSCGRFLGIEVSRPDLTTEKISIQLESIGCVCENIVIVGTTRFGFERSSPATYYLQVMQPNGLPAVEKKIVVR